MMTPKQKQELYTLLNALCEGTITDNEFDRLDHWLKSDKEACKLYVDFTLVWSDLQYFHASLYSQHNHNETLIRSMVSEPDGFTDSALWKALSEAEMTAPAVEIAAPEEPKILIEKVQRQKVVHKISKGSLISLFAVAAAVILIVLFDRFIPYTAGYKVATLTDSMNARWADSDTPISKGTRFVTGGTKYFLREGLAALRFDDEAMVTLEGPVEFQLLAEDRMQLNYGRLYARIPQGAIGFTVNTSSSRIIDLGTEFGVEANAGGDTYLHVVKGKTTLIAGEKTNKVSMEVGKGIAKKVSAGSRTVSDIACDGRLFVREINSAGNLVWRGETELSLADIVGGGNGFGTGKLDSGIETNTGLRFETPDPELVQSKVPGILSGGGSYNKVSSPPLIDGVFVPDSRKGPVQITSAGHTFDGFVDGSEVFWGNIFNGAWHASDTSLKHNLKLNGQTYGTRDNPAISIHSNQGITFDLQAIRQIIPGGRILRFTALFGVSQTVALDPLFTPKTDGLNSGKVNCWVLIDGKERFNRNSVSYLQGATEIEVDISDKDRFLTLVVTESGDRRAYDWALFAKPSLMIEMNMD
jgi:hypothetical protein